MQLARYIGADGKVLFLFSNKATLYEVLNTSSKYFREARNPDIFLFTVCSVWKNMQYHKILIEKTNPDILHQIAKSRNPD